MSNRVFKLSAAAAMLVATPALASAEIVSYSTPSPVAITSFSVNESYASGTIGGDVLEPPQFIPNGITVKFVNKSNVPATAVTFSLRDGTYSQSIVDKGIFSPGTQIKHTFGIDAGLDPFPNATVNVAEVDFADGSAWHTAPVAASATPTAPAPTTSANATIAPLSTRDSMTARQAELEQSNAEARRVEFRNLGTSL
jgi:hypothetical protein